jgi:hypothetical protein
MSILNSHCFFVILIIQRAKHMRRTTLPSVDCLDVPHFSALSRKRHGFEKYIYIFELTKFASILLKIFV